MGTRSSPKVMTAMMSSLEPLWEPLDGDNGQQDHTCDWDCLTMQTLVPRPQFFVYLTCSSCLYPDEG
jgi:hypothetical protein